MRSVLPRSKLVCSTWGLLEEAVYTMSYYVISYYIILCEQLPNHRHRNLKAFEEHVQNTFIIVSLQSNVYITFLGWGLGWSGNCSLCYIVLYYIIHIPESFLAIASKCHSMLQTSRGLRPPLQIRSVENWLRTSREGGLRIECSRFDRSRTGCGQVATEAYAQSAY